MLDLVARGYVPDPCYPPAGGAVGWGWDRLAARVGDHVAVVAIDGPVVAGWEELGAGLAGGFSRRGRSISVPQHGAVVVALGKGAGGHFFVRTARRP